ncbi:MAG: N-6 DNA methylase [Thermoplasmatales archaeon]|nr:N-6 DNA methylase [Thermoplasmatales archaeon]
MEKIVHNSYGSAYHRLKEIFKKYNEVYNGGLFAIGTDNDCDVIDIDGKIVQEMVSLLYMSKDKQYVYNFDWINADILGQVYEQYLGKILAQTKTGKTSLMNGITYRKEQGIYYTPTYIVEYIVDSTLDGILNAKGFNARNIKIIDPACGSGSFLIKAFDRLISRLYKDVEVKQDRIDEQGKYTFKTEILKNNLYGVDLDEKAVEITKLNLLLKAAERYRKLPGEVDLRIKHGNSLIQSENVAGLNAFKWEERFPEVTDAGGFDVVIGNPPYIDSEEMSRSQPETREECRTTYECAKGNWDLFCIFLEKGIKLLKDGGYLGMIVPNKLLSADYAEQTRKFLAKYSVKIIRDYSRVPVFNASVYPIVIVVQKSKALRNTTKVEVIELKKEVPVIVSSKVVNYRELTKGENRSWSHILSDSSTNGAIFKGKVHKLGDIAQVIGAATVSEAYEIKKIIKEQTEDDINYYKFVNTGTLDRYSCLWGVFKTRYIKESYNRPIVGIDKLEHFSKKRLEQTNYTKIIVGGMTKRLECYLDYGQCLAGKSTTVIISKDDLRPIIAILNSKFMSSYYRTMFSGLSLSGGFIRVGPPQIKELQIKISNKFKREVIPLVNKITTLNNEINEMGIKHTEKRARLEEEIQRIDKKIDILVYELYGITDEQRDLIEKEIM